MAVKIKEKQSSTELHSIMAYDQQAPTYVTTYVCSKDELTCIFYWGDDYAST